MVFSRYRGGRVMEQFNGGSLVATPIFSQASPVDVLLYVVILVLFASWITVHAWLCARLCAVSVWKGCVALLVPPLAPLWGQRFGSLSVAWMLLLVLYGASLLAGLL